MKNLNQTRRQGRTAFTLIELLVVIAIIGVLAALIFPALRAAKISSTRSKVQTELRQIEIAIEAYKSKFGIYPPDNPGRPEFNQLFYELQGTTNVIVGPTNVFRTLDGRTEAEIPVASVSTAFGAGVAGFVNCSKAGSADDSKIAEKFLSGLRPDHYFISTNGVPAWGVLVCPVPLPLNVPAVLPNLPGVNPWRYNSSSPVHNPKSYDLWVDVVLGGKTNRISNWNKNYEIVSTP